MALAQLHGLLHCQGEGEVDLPDASASVLQEPEVLVVLHRLLALGNGTKDSSMRHMDLVHGVEKEDALLAFIVDRRRLFDGLEIPNPDPSVTADCDQLT